MSYSDREKIFKAFANDARLEIMDILWSSPTDWVMSVKYVHLMLRYSKIGIPTVNAHLGILLKLGLVEYNDPIKFKKFGILTSGTVYRLSKKGKKFYESVIEACEEFEKSKNIKNDILP